MMKLTPTLLAALLLTGLCTTAPVQAEGETSTGSTLQAKADIVRDTVLKNDAQALYDNLAPWIQSRLKLVCATVRKEARYIRDNAREGDIERVNARLGLNHRGSDSDELLNELCDASPTLYLKLSLLAHHDVDLPADATEWLTTERIIATEDVSESHRMLGENARRRVGIVEFSHPDSWRRIVVRCVDEGDSWQVVDLSSGFGADLSDVVSEGGPSAVYLDFAAPDWRKLELRRTEGEQLMGSGRDYARVEYSKSEIAPKKFSDSMEEFESAFTGDYYKLRDTIYKKPDMERGAVVAEPVDDEDLGYAALYFSYGSGESEFKWYDTKEELEEALTNFQAAK